MTTNLHFSQKKRHFIGKRMLFIEYLTVHRFLHNKNILHKQCIERFVSNLFSIKIFLCIDYFL